ncbi:MAG: hypothetical protein HC802_17865 [Caldilineaceae bacterium]|nr:hypothetical protein [Caldilineaceae bacterium]
MSVYVCGHDDAGSRTTRYRLALGWTTASLAENCAGRWLGERSTIAGLGWGSRLRAPGESIVMRLVWQANRAIDDDLTAFVHLVGEDGLPIAQSDRAPQDGFYPTRAWQPDEAVEDFYTLEIPADQSPAEYRLVVGWYDPETGARLPIQEGAETFELARLMVVQ